MRLTLLALLAASASTANAAITFYMQYSGVSFGNTASASGFITFDETLLTSSINRASLSPTVQNVYLVVIGSESGDGVFTANNFVEFNWETNGAVLDFTKELVGQPTSGNSWGTPSEGGGGDFNLFSSSLLSGPAVGNAPNGSWWFTLRTSNGNDMLLTSFSAVPEPSTYGLMLGGLALAGAAIRRRKLAK